MLRYCDEVMMYAGNFPVASEVERLSWMRRRDETIHTEMAALMNDGMAGDETLATAASKHHHMCGRACNALPATTGHVVEHP